MHGSNLISESGARRGAQVRSLNGAPVVLELRLGSEVGIDLHVQTIDPHLSTTFGIVSFRNNQQVQIVSDGGFGRVNR
jgi:hypothetical protein